MVKGNDEQLIIDYLKGDQNALEALIRRYLKPIYSFVYHFVGNSQEAEDITQEVFVKVWRNLKKPVPSLSKGPVLSLSKGFDPKKGKFKTWIFAIAKNTSLDWLKKKRSVLFSEFEDEKGKNAFVENLTDPSLLPDKIMEKTNIKNIISSAMNRLSSNYRLILSLYYDNCLTFREISERIGEPLNTVKSRHRRGLMLLKKIISKY